MAQPRTCIICGKAAGSGEHIFPASLGGRRTHRGIYCNDHDRGFSPLVSVMAYQVRMLNGQLEVVNDHRKREGFVAPEVASADGTAYAISGDALIPQRSRVLARSVGGDGREKLQLAVPEGRMGMLRELERRGDIEIRATGAPVTSIVGRERFTLMFGGARFLSGVAYIAMSYLAKYHPQLARQEAPGLAAIKASLVAAAAAEKDENVNMPDCVWWETPDVLEQLPRATHRFAHTVVVSTNEDTKRAGAYLCLFGTICFGVDFGELGALVDHTVVVHLDPQAPRAPDDQEEVELRGVGLRIAPPSGSATDNLRKAVQDGTAERYFGLFQRRVEDWHVERAACELLDALETIRPDTLTTATGRQPIHDLVENYNQRVYRMMCKFSSGLPQALNNVLPSDAGLLLASHIAGMVERDETRPGGLTDLASTSLALAKAALAEKIAGEHRDGSLTLEKIKLLLGGGLGVATVGRAMLEPLMGAVLAPKWQLWSVTDS